MSNNKIKLFRVFGMFLSTIPLIIVSIAAPSLLGLALGAFVIGLVAGTIAGIWRF